MKCEQKKWLNQYYSNFGGKEILKLVCAIFIWMGIAIALGIVFDPKIIGVMFIPMFIASSLCARWQPSYMLFRKIIGNENFPPTAMPRRIKSTEHREWWSYLPSIWWILIDILLLLAVLGWLSR